MSRCPLRTGSAWVRLCDCMWVCFDARERTICGLATVAGGRGAVWNMEFGKVERALSKKLNSTVVVYKSKTKPG